jgi:hypothetical protein
VTGWRSILRRSALMSVVVVADIGERQGTPCDARSGGYRHDPHRPEVRVLAIQRVGRQGPALEEPN